MLLGVFATPYGQRRCLFAYQRPQTSGELLPVGTRAPGASANQVAWGALRPGEDEVGDWSSHPHTTPSPSQRVSECRGQQSLALAWQTARCEGLCQTTRGDVAMA